MCSPAGGHARSGAALGVPASPPFVLILHVAGMTDMTCVKRVRDALESIPGVASAQVSLENQRAQVILMSSEASGFDADQLVSALLQNTGKIATVVSAPVPATPAVLRVNGMTCMACVARVKQAIESFDAVLSADVSLENGRADLLLLPAATVHLNDIAETVRNETGKHVAPLHDSTTSQSCALRVEGMTCMSCVSRVKDALQAVSGVISAEVSLENARADVLFENGVVVNPEVLVREIQDRTGKLSALILDSGDDAAVHQVEEQGTELSEDHARLIVLRVDGMSCMGCVGRVKDTIESTPGVIDASVSLETGLADVRLSPDAALDACQLAQIVTEQTGKNASSVQDEQESLYLRVAGMTCMSCVRRVKGALEGIAGVLVADVSLESGIAKVALNPGSRVAVEDLVLAVRTESGKEAVVLSCDGEGSLVESNVPEKDYERKDVQNIVSQEEPVSPAIVIGRRVQHAASPVFDAEIAGAQEQSSTGSTADTAVMSTFKIGGMTCSSCVGLVEKVIMALPAVQSARVNLLAGRASVHHDCAVTGASAIVDAVSSAGYSCSILNSGGNAKDQRSKPAMVVFRCQSMQHAVAALNVLRSSRQSHGVLDAEVCEPGELRVRLAPHATLVTILRILESSPGVGSLTLVVDPTVDMQAYSTASNKDSEVAVWRSRFALALCFSLPLIIIGFLSNHTSLLSESVASWLEFALATPVQFVCGRGFYRASYFALRKGRATMDVLIALSTSIAYFTSVAVLLHNFLGVGDSSSSTGTHLSAHIRGIGHSAMFNVSAMIITIVLLGKWLEATAKRRAADGVAALSALAPKDAVLFDGDMRVCRQTRVPVSLLRVGDLVRLSPSERVPVDAVVVEGHSAVDESMLTGESNLVPKLPGDFVYGGTVNGGNSSGTMLLQTAATESEAVLAQIVRLVDEAQTSRAPIEAYADRMSAVFVPGVVSLAIVVFIAWFLLASLSKIPLQWYADEGAFTFALLFALETMVIACPCALGLATPTAVMVASEVGTRLGVLVRGGGAALEAAQRVKTVLFDKTGTLTLGKPEVVSTVVGTQAHSKSKHDALSLVTALVAVVEAESRHPLATAIVNYARETSGSQTVQSEQDAEFRICEVEELPGRGMRASLNDGEYKVIIGSLSWALNGRERKLLTDDELQAVDRLERDEGFTVVAAVVNDAFVVVFALQDCVRPEAADVIAYLQNNLGITCGIVTGDSEGTALAVAHKVGIDASQVVAQALPWTKVDTLKSLPPGSSCFVGDGINDAPALAAADVGIAIGAGAQIASENASIVLVRSDLIGVVQTIDLARESFARVRLNLIWALGYNLLGIPLAAGAFYPLFQVRVPPILASVSMALSSTCVVLSSLALRWYRPPRVGQASGQFAATDGALDFGKSHGTELQRRKDKGPVYVLIDDGESEDVKPQNGMASPPLAAQPGNMYPPKYQLLPV